jgi:hypothetical protein
MKRFRQMATLNLSDLIAPLPASPAIECGDIISFEA